jgi:hypothetical protein
MQPLPDSAILVRFVVLFLRELQGWDKVRFHLCTIDNRRRSPALVMLTSHLLGKHTDLYSLPHRCLSAILDEENFFPLSSRTGA